MPPSLSDFPLTDADLCVKCGLCLPHCPTYRLTQHEADSPRGRIALMQGLATNLIAITPKLEQHLDGCLSCRACEPVCPAKVPYGKLIDAGRELMLQKAPQRGQALRWLAPWLVRPALRNLIGTLLWAYQRIGMQWLVRRLRLLGHGRLARLESLMPRLSFPRALTGAAAAGNVALFTGCTGELADRKTLQAALKILRHLGIQAEIPDAQGCCGALHQHAGMTSTASALARQNIKAFDGIKPVLCAASGCSASLLDYGQLAGSDGAAFARRVQDISAFLLENWSDRIRLNPLRARVALHTACTLKNVVKQVDAARLLLQKIPQLEIVELDTRAQCCGAAGSYFIQQAEMADRLLEGKLDAAKALGPDYIVSGNIGCTLHLAAGLRRAGITVPVLHPVALLARQLSD
jgi:glycolate oxidase iron-sulfur subunit